MREKEIPLVPKRQKNKRAKKGKKTTMRYEQDYIMRMIKEMLEVLMRIALHKRTAFHELEKDNKYGKENNIYAKLCSMAGEGKINEAENLLYENLDAEDKEYLEMGLSFYYHLNLFRNEFLEEHNYSRPEIEEGIETLMKEFHMEGLMDVAKLEIK